MQILGIILKVMTKSWGTNTLLPPPQPKSWGDLSPPVPIVVAPMIAVTFEQNVPMYVCYVDDMYTTEDRTGLESSLQLRWDWANRMKVAHCPALIHEQEVVIS